MLSWLRLIRFSGVFTLASNMLAALSVAVYSKGLDYSLLGHELYRHGDRFLVVVCLSCLLYAVGMMWNDIADYERDKELNPKRPLPSGAIALKSAVFWGWLLAIFALLLSGTLGWRGWSMTGVVLCLSFTYNFLTKSIPYLGSLTMASVRMTHAFLCLLVLDPVYFDRMLHTLLAQLGLLDLYFAEATPIYPLLLFAYIFGVTLISELETRAGRRAELLLGGALIVSSLIGAFFLALSAHWIADLQQQGKTILLGIAVLLVFLLTLWQGWRIGKPFVQAVVSGRKEKVPPVLIAGLGGIILFDGLIACAFHPIMGLLALGLLPFFVFFGRLMRMN